MPIYLLIIFAVPLLSLVWWTWADRRLRGLGSTGSKARVALGLAVLFILLGFGWVLLGRRHLLAVPLPAEWYALVLLWGLIFLPLVGVPMMVVWSLGSIVRQIFGRKSIPHDPAVRRWTRREWLAGGLVSMPVWATFGTAAFSLPRLTRCVVTKPPVPTSSSTIVAPTTSVAGNTMVNSTVPSAVAFDADQQRAVNLVGTAAGATNNGHTDQHQQHRQPPHSGSGNSPTAPGVPNS